MRQRFVAVLVVALSLAPAAVALAQAQPAAPAPGPSAPPAAAPALPSNINLSDPTVARILNDVISIVRATAGNGLSQLDHLASDSRGQVTFFRRYDLQIRTARNAYRDVHLHPGTIINPRGATIALGQTVSVSGDARPDGSLSANAITIVQ